MKLKYDGDEDREQRVTKKQVVIIVAAVAVAVILCAVLVLILVKRFGFERDEDGNQRSWGDVISQEDDGRTEMEKDVDYLNDNEIDIPELEIDLAKLRESVNEDIYAWIYIPDTEINYPVLQHPSDDSYYLEHNLDGSEGYPGVIYSESCNSTDFKDPLTVLYGHNMKDGSMFGGLQEFLDKEYFDSHPYIYIYTEDRLRIYEIVAAYPYSDRHLLLNDDLTENANYINYLADMATDARKSGIWKAGTSLQSDDRLLALSTCISNQRDNRLIIQGRLLRK